MLSTFAKSLTMNMPEVSVGPQPVTTTQGETLEAAGVSMLQQSEESWTDQKGYH